ncbi:MAG: M24 family metallopeptidase [Holosporaceae bacterium]|jgi:Xaa-Pro aminopeptidase|nr:M24 family metallopeptidase [Holosporaceae bacterium]
MGFQIFLRNSGFQALMHQKSGRYCGLDDGDLLRRMTGLQSSAGAVVATASRAALFVDSRYSLAARQTVACGKFEILNLKREEITEWMEGNTSPGGGIAYDPEFYTHEEMEFLQTRLKNRNFVPVCLKQIFGIWRVKRRLEVHRLPGGTSDKKISFVLEAIHKNRLEAYLICDPCTVSWLLDIRDFDRKYIPAVAGRLLVRKNGESTLYLDEDYLFDYQSNYKSAKFLQADLNTLENLGVDKFETPFHLKHGNLVHLRNPCLLAKAMKNTSEINDIRRVVLEDSAAMVDFLRWFHCNSGKISELEAVGKLRYFRELRKDFVGESFETIAAADDHAAVVHYIPNEKSNRIVENILLFDSGGQYRYGTTDVTRTVALLEPTEEQKLFYTLVLKGHIALAMAKFPVGTTGAQLDPLARQFLWKYSSDYGHSTGHGVGYALDVHEGPCAIAKNSGVPLEIGMILSDEPGYYRENEFGIRLENMMLVRRESEGFLSFEILSLAPFDEKFIDEKLLTDDEITWLRDYHEKVESSLGTTKA